MPQAPTAETRPSPEALLEDAHREQRGKLKIFLGAAPGVGKTYEMLLAARKKAADGVDVVIGLVETHGRRETEALIEGLTMLPRLTLDYKGRTLHELDLDALLQRRPQLALVDELAHTNPDGARHPKRYQDIEELLTAGIDVYTTLNIQHIESLNDVVARITQVRIRETVPDNVFNDANEVEVVDLTPDELIQRLNEGKVYADEQAQRALRHYFKPGNLTALRELALRRTAERVDDQMRQYMRKHAIHGPWAARERVVVCINEYPSAAELVRRAKRLAARLDAPWFAVYVETARTHQLNTRQRERVTDTLRLAESLGAETRTLPGSRRIAEDVIAFARDNNITQIIIGKTQRPWWFKLLHGSVVQDLVASADGINIHILAEGAQPDDEAPAAKTPAPVSIATIAYVNTVLMVAAATLIGRGVVALVAVPNISLVFLAAVLWSAMRYGLRPSLFASVLSTLSYNFFFTEPLYTLSVANPSHLLALIFFCIVAVLTSTLTGRERLQAYSAREQAQTTAALLAFSRKLAGIRKLDTLMAATAAQIANLLRVDAVLLLPNGRNGALLPVASAPAGGALDEADAAAAAWCWDRNRPAGRGTDTLPGCRRLFLPLRTSQGIVGVVGVSRDDPGFRLTPGERQVLDAVTDLAAIATERIRLAKDVDQARMLAETEKLRAALLTSVSHDLKTPLASIIGSISSLRSYGSRYDDATRDEMLANAQDEAERLNRYVANLLDMTRLDAGALEPKREPCDLQDLVAVALRRTAKALAQHRVKISVPASLPLLRLDEALMEQVLVNLLDNAAKYTPLGSTVEVSASRHRFSVVIIVRDEGPGIAEQDRQRVFDKFFRVREDADRSRAGTGLGLAICRGFVEAMGGRIYVRDRSGGGAEFVIEFPAEIIAEMPSEVREPDTP